MGIPKFFRFISERYPCLSELVREEKIPEFDNLYLDMNGIIHNCTHPEDGNVHFRMTEEEMYRDIFQYVDKLFFLIKPKKLFFLAVDGVAPRAKMNQQRSRRFRSAKEAETLQKAALMKGEILPEAERFDSNCITPGTEFMVRLQDSLKKFIMFKMSSCARWQGVRIILSGHETPGEGEHKIMEYIRYLKENPEYDVNARHCLYGLDADLIILGLCTHELHFALLREEVRFGRKAKRTTLEETRFYLFHLTLLRDYLELEFQCLKSYGHFDIDRIIDDWVLMGFLVGNDFIPHLPFLHINEDALPTLYEAYRKCWPEFYGYINESGNLHLGRLQILLDSLAKYEKIAIDQAIGDLRYLEGKRSTKEKTDIFDPFDSADPSDINIIDDDLNNLIKETEMFMENIDDNEINEVTAFKRNYYITKLKCSDFNPEIVFEQTKCYITALQWILYYYYKGVPSWGWFYPHHYAPFVSDMKNISDIIIKFDLGKPFLPFQQLLAVLPAASKRLLPKPFWDLMINPNSSLINYYPHEFETDLNGKKQDWEAVVLIPFIDEGELLKAMEPCIEQLSPEEHARNIHGPMLQYDYVKTASHSGPTTLNSFGGNGFCKETIVWREDLQLSKSNSSRTDKRIFQKGFPTLKFLKHKAELRKSRVKVFEQPSRKENMILIPEANSDLNSLVTVAEKCLNKIIFIGWPHLIEAKVVAISSREDKINSFGQIQKNNEKEFDLYSKRIYDHNMNRMGIDFQEIAILIHALPFAGWEQTYNLNGKILSGRIWSTVEIAYPVQGIVFNAFEMIDNRDNLRIENVFPTGSSIFMLGQPYYGCEGKVLDPLLVYACGRMKVSITVLPEPDLSDARAIQNSLEAKYFNQFDTATKLGIPVTCLARITGSVIVIKGEKRMNLPENVPKVNIGLQLRYHKSNEELVGYTRKVGNTWLYSNKAIELIKSYYNTFPNLFELITSTSNREDIFESELLSYMEEEDLTLNNIITWLKDQEHKQAERVSCGTKTIQKEALVSIISALEKLKSLPVRNVKLQVKPHLVLRPGQKVPEISKLKKPLRLFDRVVLIKDTYQVPFGCRGTIVTIHPVTDLNPVRIECINTVEMFYEILLDKELPEGNQLHGLGAGRIFKVSEHVVIPTYDTESRINRNANNKIIEFSQFKSDSNEIAPNMESVQKGFRQVGKVTNFTKDVKENMMAGSIKNCKILFSESTKSDTKGYLNEASTIVLDKKSCNINYYRKFSENEPTVIEKQLRRGNYFIQPPPLGDQFVKRPNDFSARNDYWKDSVNNQENFSKQRAKVIFKGEDNICNKINTDKTEALKELLGLSCKSQINKAQTTKSVLPQPPQNWRTESFRASIKAPHDCRSLPTPNSQYRYSTKTMSSSAVNESVPEMMPSGKLNDGISKESERNRNKKKSFQRKTPKIAARFDNIC